MSASQPSPFARAARIARLIGHLLYGVAVATLWLPIASPAERRVRIQRWSARVLKILHIGLDVRGRPPDGSEPVLLVANHVSWVDIFAMNAVVPVRFVSKSEVRGWPLIGWLAARSGTVFIERARRRDTARVNDAVAAALRNGQPVAVFPEGMAGDGTRVLKFHGSLLQPALNAGAQIRPVAVAYRRSDGSRSTEIAYDGDKSLWHTVKLITTQRELTVSLTYLPALQSQELHRREVAAVAQRVISETLGLPAADTATRTTGHHRGESR
jgi:1-acyl-sn-glycerol-3-phosphate acyltransferase